MLPDSAQEQVSHLFLRLVTLSSCIEFRMFAYCHSEKESASAGESEHEKCVTIFTKSNCGGISKNSGRISDAMKEPWCPQLRGYSRHPHTKLSQGRSNSATDIVKYRRMLKTIFKVPFRPFHYCIVYRRSGSVNEESPIPLSYKETSSQSRATQSVQPGASDRKSDPKWYGSRTSRSSFLPHIGGNSYL